MSRSTLEPLVSFRDEAIARLQSIRRDHKAVTHAFRTGRVDEDFYLEARLFVVNAELAVDDAEVKLRRAAVERDAK